MSLPAQSATEACVAAKQHGAAAAPLTVAQALSQALSAGLDRLDAQLLLSHHMQQPRTWLIAHDDAALTSAVAQDFAAGCQRRAEGEPLAYLLGEQEFHGLRLRVSRDVLVPRPDTETLVDWALDLLPGLRAAAPRVLDLGTGSGAIALAVAHRHPAARVTATDLSPAALQVARGNADLLGLVLDWACGAWWQALPAAARFDLVLANPPYIAADDPHLPALRHEPLLALSPGGDGLSALQQIIAGAPAHLTAGGWLLMEHGWDQAAPVAAALRQAGFTQVTCRQDLAGRSRCSGGQRAAQP